MPCVYNTVMFFCVSIESEMTIVHSDSLPKYFCPFFSLTIENSDDVPRPWASHSHHSHCKWSYAVLYSTDQGLHQSSEYTTPYMHMLSHRFCSVDNSLWRQSYLSSFSYNNTLTQAPPPQQEKYAELSFHGSKSPQPSLPPLPSLSPSIEPPVEYSTVCAPKKPPRRPPPSSGLKESSQIAVGGVSSGDKHPLGGAYSTLLEKHSFTAGSMWTVCCTLKAWNVWEMSTTYMHKITTPCIVRYVGNNITCLHTITTPCIVRVNMTTYI